MISQDHDSIKGKARLFVDDTIVYLTIKSTQDDYTLQKDPNSLENWESDSSMEFNPDKYCSTVWHPWQSTN
jgi:hypothetical protein